MKEEEDSLEYMKSTMGVDKYHEIEQFLVDSLRDEIDEQILFKLTGMDKSAREKVLKRNNRIDDLLND